MIKFVRAETGEWVGINHIVDFCASGTDAYGKVYGATIDESYLFIDDLSSLKDAQDALDAWIRFLNTDGDVRFLNTDGDE